MFPSMYFYIVASQRKIAKDLILFVKESVAFSKDLFTCKKSDQTIDTNYFLCLSNIGRKMACNNVKNVMQINISYLCTVQFKQFKSHVPKVSLSHFMYSI